MKTLIITFCAVLAFSNARVLNSGILSQMGVESIPTGPLTTEEIYGQISGYTPEQVILPNGLVVPGIQQGITDTWGSPIVTMNPYLQRLLQRNVVPISLVNVPLRSEVMRNIVSSVAVPTPVGRTIEEIEMTVPTMGQQETLAKNTLKEVRRNEQIVSENLGLPVETIVGNMDTIQIPQRNIIQRQLVKNIIKNEVLSQRGSLPVDMIERQIESDTIEEQVAIRIMRKLVKDIERNVALSQVFRLPIGTIKRTTESTPIYEKLVYLTNVQGGPFTQLLAKMARNTLSEIEEVLAKRVTLLVSPETLEQLTTTNPMPISELARCILSGEEEILALRYGVPVEIIRRQIQVPVFERMIEFVKQIEQILSQRGIPLGYETSLGSNILPVQRLTQLSRVMAEREGLERSMMPLQTSKMLGSYIEKQVGIEIVKELVRDIERNVALSQVFGLPVGTVRRTMETTSIYERLVYLANGRGSPFAQILAQLARNTLSEIEEILAKRVSLLVSSETLEQLTLKNPMSISELTRCILSGREEILALRYGVPVEVIRRQIQVPVTERLIQFVRQIEKILTQSGMSLGFETSIERNILPAQRLAQLSRGLGESERLESLTTPCGMGSWPCDVRSGWYGLGSRPYGLGMRSGPYSEGYSLYGMLSGRYGMGSGLYGQGWGYPMMGQGGYGRMGQDVMNRPVFVGSQM